MKRLLVLAAVAALAACGQQQAANTYPPQYELNFMRSCQAQNPAEGLCTCTWAKIEGEVPVADFAAFERMSTNEQVAHPLRGQIERYALECLNENQVTPAETIAPSAP